MRCRSALASLPDETTMSGRSYLTTRRASGTLACTADEFVHPAGLHRLHCAMCLLATAMMLRRRRTQAEAPGLAGVTWLVSLNHRKRWIAAWGQRVPHPLRQECCASYFEEAQLFKRQDARACTVLSYLYNVAGQPEPPEALDSSVGAAGASSPASRVLCQLL